MGSNGKNNQHLGGTSAHVLDQWTPLTPTKPDLTLTDSTESPINPTGEGIHDSNCCHVQAGNVDDMNVLEVNDGDGEGQRISFVQLLQSCPFPLVNDSGFSYSPELNHQTLGFNQLMHMADSMALNHGLHGSAGMNSFRQDSFQVSSSMQTGIVQTHRNGYYEVLPFAPATPDLRRMQNMYVSNPANLCIDGQGKRCENYISDQIHFSLEGDSAISQDQVDHLNQKHASIRQLVNSNMEKSSAMSHQSIFTAFPTSTQPDTLLKGSRVPEGDEACQTIDHNDSPSQKPKRRKHRPKVVREAKVKKTQDPVTSQQTPRVKRKYVRKSIPKDITTTPPECSLSPSESFTRRGDKKASCRRALNFNSPDCQSRSSIINGKSCMSVVDNRSDPQPKGMRKEGYLQLKSGDGIVIDLNYLPTETKDFESENFTPRNRIVRTGPMQENMKHLARRINTEHQATKMKTKSLKDLTGDFSNNKMGLKRGFYGSNAMSNNSLNHCKKSKPLFQNSDSRTDSTTESNGYSSQLEHRYIHERIEHDRMISNLRCNGSSLCSSCQDINVNGLSSSMQFVSAERSSDIPSHFPHTPKIACGIMSCQATSEILKMDAESEHAIMLYNGNKQIISYEGPEIKKKPRGKVNLDGETLRVWDMLMWKEGDDTNEKQNSKSEEWWAEERRIFEKRVDNFITFMHAIQGNRRFSKWKGSVLDSVVGVFLTQNVSDHLSSSAFMSLAARFPLHPKPSCNGETNCDPPVRSEGKETVCEQGMSSEHLKSSFKEIFQIPVDDNKIFLNEEADLCHEKGYGNEEDKVGSSQFSTYLNKDEPKAQNDLLDARSCVENMTMKNHVSQPGHEDVCEILEVEDVVASQNSVVSSSSCLPLVHEACSNTPYHMETNVVSGSRIFEKTDTSFCELLQMQEALADQAKNDSNGNTCERWSIDPHEDVLSSHGFNYADYPGLSQEYMHHSARFATSLPFSALTCSSIDNPDIQTSGDVVQPSFESESWLVARLKHKLESELQSETLESMEGDSYVNNMYSVQTRAAQPKSSGKLTGRELLTERLEQLSGTANQVWTDSVGGEKAAECATICSNLAANSRQNSNYGQDIRSTTLKHNTKEKKIKKGKDSDIDWDSLRKEALKHQKGPRSPDTMDSLDYEAVRCADVREVSDAIKDRGMNNRLAKRIQEMLNRLMQDHGSLDLEWLRDVPPEKAKKYLISINGLGLKSVECVRLLTLLQLAFPVDTNVGRIAVRLGWVPLQPLPESLQLHLLELYPVLESVQKYLWPRLCTLSQEKLYELHYQMITFGKVFCTKARPNCNACPLRAECRHFASAFASARLLLTGPEDKSLTLSTVPYATSSEYHIPNNHLPFLTLESSHLGSECNVKTSEPIIEEPLSPEPEPEDIEISQDDIEEAFWENDIEDIPTIRLNVKQFSRSIKNYMRENMAELSDADMSLALVTMSEEAASIPMQKLKNISRLRTEHQVYELPDDHVLLSGLELREKDDPSPYLLAIWTPGETANSVESPETVCSSQQSGSLCNNDVCFACNSKREAFTQTVRGTILIPCRTATRGSFPLNGTYFQVNEIFADHATSIEPINVPRSLIWNLQRRTVYFGTTIPTIFRGQTKDAIQRCFWQGYVCVRGFDRTTRAPRPLMARLHLSENKAMKMKRGEKKPGGRKRENSMQQK